MNKIFDGLFSIYEDKKSSVVIVFLLISGFGIRSLWLSGDIPDNVTTIILTLSGLIFGVNSISTIVSGIGKNLNNNNGYNSGYNSYGNYNSNYNSINEISSVDEKITDKPSI